MIEWRPIETMPFGELVILYFDHGEVGGGEIDLNWVYEFMEGRWVYWTCGGPNGGSDFERDEKPALWAEWKPVRTAARAALKQD